jgi:aromatic ring-opening dioxygenase catalytic subunit (LigB family)
MAISRRRAIGLLGLSLAAAVTGCRERGGVAASTAPPKPAAKPVLASKGDVTRPETSRMPVVFLPHGGGPWPFMDLDRLGIAGSYVEMERYLKQLGMVAPQQPKALLVVSAHWEETVPTVMSAQRPPMLYDYSGFPAHTYDIEWPAPGAPEVAERTRELLERAGIASGVDSLRGFDHGTFVPMILTYPDAEVPTFQLSLKRGLDPKAHLAVGRALQPLRDEGVFIIGSGMSYHNMGGFFGHVPTALDDSHAFDDWLAEAVMAEADRRDTRLAEWARAPRALLCHPREEHLLPLMVCAGAAGDDAAAIPYRDVVMNALVSAVHFG